MGLTLKFMKMNYNRRHFIKTGTTLASAMAFASVVNPLSAGFFAPGLKKNKKFGLQLYSLRDVLPSDPKGILKQVAAFGYKQVESYEHDKLGIFWGMKNTEFKQYMDDLGMEIISSHCKYTENFERKADEAATIGMKYLICPHVGAQKDIDTFKRFADTFNKCGEICRQRGIHFAYHNHEYSFKLLEGQFPQDVMMQHTDKSLVDFQMDMYWVVTAGQDPVAWLNKYPDRFRLGHLKDRIQNATERDASCTLGTGGIDYFKIIKEAKKNGMQYFIVEQERYDGTTPLKAAQDDAAYMKKLLA